MTEFGHIIDLNVGTVSGIVTGNRPISVHQLDRITMGMNLPPDYFYERYIDECIEEEPLNWRRISPFLYRCVELGRLDCLRRVVGMLLDNPVYLPSLFEVAEDSFKKGNTEAAAFLYENVSEGKSISIQNDWRFASIDCLRFVLETIKRKTMMQPFNLSLTLID